MNINTSSNAKVWYIHSKDCDMNTTEVHIPWTHLQSCTLYSREWTWTVPGKCPPQMSHFSDDTHPKLLLLPPVWRVTYNKQIAMLHWLWSQFSWAVQFQPQMPHLGRHIIYCGSKGLKIAFFNQMVVMFKHQNSGLRYVIVASATNQVHVHVNRVH